VIDFARTSEDVKSYFVKFNNDLNTLFMMLQNIYGVELKERKSLIIFDN
jgi:Zn-dependent oligopeptidase